MTDLVPAACKVVAVVVSYNRADLLAAALDAIDAQTRPADRILVVDNASSDDSLAVARAHPSRPTVLALPTNLGGAGGFAVGLDHAVRRERADLVWLMDDDTIPLPTALAELLHARAAYPGHVDLLGSMAVWTDGRAHPMNTPRRKPFASAREIAAARRAGAVPVRSASFVSMLVDAEAVRAHGLPVADYFIWNDDFEFSARLLRHGTGLFVPTSVVEHRTKTFGGTDADPGDRFYYEVRNKAWMLTRSRALGPGERLLYTAASLRRWARTVARSTDRPRLLRAGGRGLRDGLTTRPRPGAVVLGLRPDDAASPGRLCADGVRRPRAGGAASPAGDRAVRIAADGASLPAATPRTSGGADPVHTDDQPASSDLSRAPLPRFSVLLPVYHGDAPAFLRRSFLSVTVEQTLAPAEVVLVRDGPVGPELERALAELPGLTDVPVRPVTLEENVGLARALTEGLAVCTHDVVARQDADDISAPDRFARQLPLIAAGYDLVGSAIREFTDEADATGQVRVPPVGAERIARYARFHDPFNHPSVVYRRGAVAEAGGYRDLPLLEDYWLFARMIAAGARCANLPEPLVAYRIGAGAYARRGGRRLFASELRLQRELRSEGFITPAQYVRNVAVRASYRLVDERVRRWIYRTFLLRPNRRRAADVEDAPAAPGRLLPVTSSDAATPASPDLRGPQEARAPFAPPSAPDPEVVP